MTEVGYSQTAIAKTIGKGKSVISQDLRQNSDDRSGKSPNEIIK